MCRTYSAVRVTGLCLPTRLGLRSMQPKFSRKHAYASTHARTRAHTLTSKHIHTHTCNADSHQGAAGRRGWIGIDVHLRLRAADCAAGKCRNGAGAGGAARPLSRQVCSLSHQCRRSHCGSGLYRYLCVQYLCVHVCCCSTLIRYIYTHIHSDICMIYIYVYIYICIYVCMYMHKRQMNTRLNARTYTPTHTFLASYKCIYVDILYVHTHTEYACVRWACVRACVYIHVHKFMFVYICIHHPQTYIHTYDDIHTSGPLFVKMNGSLRKASGKFPASMTEHLQGNTYTNLIYTANSLLRKFSEISTIPKGRSVLSNIYTCPIPRGRSALSTL